MSQKKRPGRPRTNPPKGKDLEVKKAGVQAEVQKESSDLGKIEADRKEQEEWYDRLLPALREFEQTPDSRLNQIHLVEEAASCFLYQQARHRMGAQFKRRGWPKCRCWNSFLRNRLLGFVPTKKELEDRL